MDNAAIHTGAEADIVEDLLWDMVVDGRSLNVSLSLIRLNDNRVARLQLYPSGYIATGVAC
jgi:hypothetical protein